MKLDELRQRTPGNSSCFEEWLIDVANARGAQVVTRPESASVDFPGRAELPNEQLVIALLLLQNIDSPPLLRLAAQLVSRGVVDVSKLCRWALEERVESVLGELARQALKVESDHKVWQAIHARFSSEPPPLSPILHHTRLSQPVMKNGRCNAESWILVR